MARITGKQQQRNYLAKDFNDLRLDLNQYAQTFFPDKIKDFSESSLGGLFLDIAASVGDTLSYYLDHQFNELSWSDAVEISNIERHLRNSGVKIIGRTPASVMLTFLVEIPAVSTSSGYVPQSNALPIILAGTIAKSNTNISFTLMEDINFAEKDKDGFLKASIVVGDTDDAGNPTTFILSKNGMATSASRVSQTATVGNGYNPFFTISLTNPHVSRIISVVDTEKNEYYEVESLTQDIIYKQVSNQSQDNQVVKESLIVTPATRRFTTSTSLSDRLTTLTFGGGDNSLNENTFLDPSALALPLYGKNPISRISIDPNSLLKSKTLGIAPSNTTITVTYESGGGLTHNVSANSIRTISKLSMMFPGSPSPNIANSIRGTTTVINSEAASGGANQPSIDDLRIQIPAARNSQLRMVTKQDLIARVYSLPTNFGRVSKVGCRSSSINKLSSQLYILGYDSNGNLSQASDSLKLNLKNYLNDMRLISDSVDILDCPIINYSVSVSIVLSPNALSLEVVQNVMLAIKNELKTENFQVDQPIIIADVINAIISVDGVLSMTNLEFNNISGNKNDVVYSSYSYDMEIATSRGIIVPPPGGVFEMKYPESNILVVAS